jgi:glycosyltransferase involved in cell wall biosynthesis
VDRNRVNKLLLISYNFPPINSAGVFRVATFAGHLCARGWNITVITVRGSSTETRDPRLMDLIPDDVHVVRTACPEFNRVARRMTAASVPAGPSAEAPPPTQDPSTGKKRRGRRGPIGVIGRFVHRVLTFPDQQVGWFGPLLWNAARIVRRDRIPVVMTTSPPHSSHLPILMLRSFLRFRWVVDFRDPWTAPRRVSPVALGLQRRLEHRVLKRADAIIANTRGNRDVLLEAFPDIAPQKVFVITNGFDVSRFEAVLSAAAPTRDSGADLVYVGSVYPDMLDIYIAAMNDIRARGETLPRLRIYGVFETPEEQAKIVAAGLADAIEYAGRVPYEESLRVIASAPALVLLLPHGERYRRWVPSKL